MFICVYINIHTHTYVTITQKKKRKKKECNLAIYKLWMNPKGIMLSEISDRRKYLIIPLICGL